MLKRKTRAFFILAFAASIMTGCGETQKNAIKPVTKADPFSQVEFSNVKTVKTYSEKDYDGKTVRRQRIRFSVRNGSQKTLTFQTKIEGKLSGYIEAAGFEQTADDLRAGQVMADAEYYITYKKDSYFVISYLKPGEKRTYSTTLYIRDRHSAYPKTGSWKNLKCRITQDEYTNRTSVTDAAKYGVSHSGTQKQVSYSLKQKNGRYVVTARNMTDSYMSHVTLYWIGRSKGKEYVNSAATEYLAPHEKRTFSFNARDKMTDIKPLNRILYRD